MRNYRLPASLLIASASAVAQCDVEWLATNNVGAVNGQVYAVERWDPDGAGPQPEQVLFAGEFARAGTVAQANNIVAYVPSTQTWLELDGGCNGEVRDLTVLPSGELIAVGTFTSAGGTAIDRVAAWNGTAWSAIGTGVDGPGDAALACSNGDLVVAGDFQNAGGGIARRVARWDGSTWSSLGNGVNGPAHCLTEMPNGDVVVGGNFAVAGMGPALRVARWDGANWSSFGPGLGVPILGPVRALTVLPNGDLVAGGDFTSTGGVPALHIARWDGVSWNAFGSGLSHNVYGLKTLASGELLALGTFILADGVVVSRIARWDGSNWFPYGDVSNGHIYDAVEMSNGEIFIGGPLVVAGGYFVEAVARWDGARWRSLGQIEADVYSIDETPDGKLVVAGPSGVQRFDGNTWEQLGEPDGIAYGVAVGPGGELYVSGEFSNINGVPTSGIAQYDDSNGWSPLSSAPPGASSVSVLADGRLIAFGSNGQDLRVSIFDGSSWQDTDVSSTGQIGRVVLLSTGLFAFVGNFTSIGGQSIRGIALWDGQSFQPLGSIGLFPNVRDIIELPNGDLMLSGLFSIDGGNHRPNVIRWDGTSWTSVGTGVGPSGAVFDLAELPNGDVVVGGEFTSIDGIPANHIARWDGTSWNAIGVGLNDVGGFHARANGEVWVVGPFTSAGGAPARRIARFRTTCPASVTEYGSSCSGPGGTLTLTADEQWVNSTTTYQVQGLAAQSICIAAISASQVAPGTFPFVPNLLGVVPAPGPGCELLVGGLEILTVAGPVGAAEQSYPLTLTADPALAGLTFYTQAFELDFTAGWVGTYATNALASTVGDF